ncbi:MAG: hypothetical protein A2Y97_01615 [Nitrospirae bacterium RBG_13_39_12]|nr:MAG: hypothetical protein A2Y97_01615 [Nitrospirae bacterium RBG_13_39_12]
MIDIETITSQVKRNCDISDAKYWGTYSICDFLLKLRDLYRTEKCIRPWEKIFKEEIDTWISDRENLWNELNDKEFSSIIVDGSIYPPFEVDKINADLEKKCLVYGAGFGIHMKPSFFVADLITKKTVEGYNIFISGNEYVRDLSVYPAMLQDRNIFARTDITRIILWERFEELRLKGSKKPLVFAFSKYGVTAEQEPTEDIYSHISMIAQSEVETYIHHELGEAIEETKLGNEWMSLLSELFLSRRAEIFARAVKDILSDTSEKGMIRYIIENNKEGSLGFYLVFLRGYRRLLFPEIVDAFQIFTETGDWELIDNARRNGYRKAEEYAERLLSLHKKHKKENGWIPKYIEQDILDGLQ